MKLIYTNKVWLLVDLLFTSHARWKTSPFRMLACFKSGLLFYSPQVIYPDTTDHIAFNLLIHEHSL